LQQEEEGRELAAGVLSDDRLVCFVDDRRDVGVSLGTLQMFPRG